MKWLSIFLLLLFIFFSCSPTLSNEDQLVINRIEWMDNLRVSLDTLAWPGLTDAGLQVPLVYFSDSSSWIANPTEKFLQQHSSALLWSSPTLIVYKTSKRLNELPFQMVTGMDVEDQSSFDYLMPFIYSSSPVETRKTVPDVQSTEEWASMILHEYFHGFQFRHKPLTDYYKQAINPVQADSLKKIYRRCGWFQELVDQENNLLLKALATNNTDSLKHYLSKFNSVRQGRRSLYQQFYNMDFAPYEEYYEKIEGSARYLEARLLNTYQVLPPYPKLLSSDTAYKAHLEYKGFSEEQESWLIMSEKSANYVYATGFNQLRLLDKLGIDYKAILFTKPEISLYSLLTAGLALSEQAGN